MRVLGVVAAMSLPLFLLPVNVQDAEACGAKVSVKGAKIARMRKLQGSSDRAPIAAGPIVAARATVKTGGDGGGDQLPAASGGGETKARTPKPRPRPKSEPIARKETPKEEPAATNPDMGRKTDEPPVAKEETEPSEPEPAPDKGPKGKFASHYYFGNASSILTAKSKAKLKATARWLKANPDKSVVVEGHASTNGNHAANQTLSEVRANAVKDQLVSLGVDESRISVEAFGSDRPEVKPGASPKNRRVIIVLK